VKKKRRTLIVALDVDLEQLLVLARAYEIDLEKFLVLFLL
jgi:hypothetical protein